MKSLLFLLSILFIISLTNGFLYLNTNKFKSPIPQNGTEPIKIESSADKVNISGWNGTVYSGYLNVNKTSNSSLYYIFYASNASNASDIANLTSYPLIIWLNGGPGSSSMLGAFYENGPFQLVLNKTATANNTYYEVPRLTTWNQNYSMLFVDQPIGTGGSYCQSPDELTHNQDQIAQHLYNALQQFYNLTVFSPFTKTPLFIFGESYAGKYVPMIARKILQENANVSTTKNIAIPLKGVSIGDGFTDPVTIMSEVGMFSYNLGLIDYNERITIEQNILRGRLFALQGDWASVTDTFNNYVFQNLKNFTANVNAYNIQEYGDYDTSPLDFFLNNTDNAKRYNLKVLYQQGSDSVYGNLTDDFMQPYTYAVEDILKQNLQVLVYNGQDDLIVTNPGTISWVENLNWPHADEFVQTNFVPWKNTAGDIIGYKKNSSNLELRIVNKAGHLVPKDTPESALDLASGFIHKCMGW